jgi:hypothetical protein
MKIKIKRFRVSTRRRRHGQSWFARGEYCWRKMVIDRHNGGRRPRHCAAYNVFMVECSLGGQGRVE